MKKAAAFCLAGVLLVFSLSEAAYVEVLRGGANPLLSYPPDGRVQLSAGKNQQAVTLPSGDSWRASFDPAAGTVTLASVKGTLDLLVSCSVRISVPEGSSIVLKLNAEGYLEYLDLPSSSGGTVLVSFANGMSFAIEPGCRLAFTYLADGTLRIDVAAGRARYTDAQGNPRPVGAGFACYTGCEKPLPYWRIAAPADQRPASAGTP